jgi:hypothetical protein
MDYTKGKWIAHPTGYRDGRTLGWYVTSEDREIAEVKTYPKPDAIAENAECESNARLIASAPDMHEALQEAYDFIYKVCASNKFGTIKDRLPSGEQTLLHHKIKKILERLL